MKAYAPISYDDARSNADKIADEDLKRRVLAGMELLKEKHGEEWVEFVDPDTLLMDSPSQCILGQLYDNARLTPGQHREVEQYGSFHGMPDVAVPGYFKALVIIDGDMQGAPSLWGFDTLDEEYEELGAAWMTVLELTTMSSVDITELDDVRAMLERDEKEREKAARKAPAGFDPACVFLLKLGYENLFEPIGDFKVRCKGCGRTVVLWNRQKHYDRHRAALESGNINKTKEDDDVAKAGPKELADRARREERAAEAAAGVKPTKVPAKTPPAETDAESAQEDASLKPQHEQSMAVFAELMTRAGKKLKGLETKPNYKVGYVSIKQDGRLIGYGWLTGKDDLRLETAHDVGDIAKDDRVVLCKRSKDMASRARITNDTMGYTLGVVMLTAAAKKQAAR